MPNKSTHHLFGPWLRYQRHDQHLTLAELGKRAGVTKGAISRIENGRDVQLSTLTKLCHALNCSITIAPPVKSPLPL